MTQLFSTNAELTALNQHALTQKKVTVINDDAGKWLETHQGIYDVIIADFPDPSNFGLGKLYSVPMYRLIKQHLAQTGIFVVQSTSPYFAKQSFWCIDATLKEAGFFTYPYHALVPSFGEWGYVLAKKQDNYQIPTHYHLPMKFLDADSTRLMFSFAPDMQPVKVEANHLNNQALVHYFEQDWGRVIR
jgi:spermidine synthase